MDKTSKTNTQISIGDASGKIKTLTFDEIRIGEELPAFTKWITAKSAQRFAATYDDVSSGHINPQASERQFGIALMPVQGAVIEAGVTPLIINWLRSARPWYYGGKQETRFLQIVLPGDTLIYHGKVSDKKMEGDKKYVMVDVFAENQRGEKVMVANARVSF